MTIVFAHRGAAAERPENTLPSFRRALELGADALETDVHLTADGEIVAAHDEHGARMTGVARALRSATLAEIQSWDAGYGFVDAQGGRPFQGQGYRIPSLHELLRELPSGTRLNVDLKTEEPALVERFITIVREHAAEERVIAASFFRSTLVHLRRLGWCGDSSLSQPEFLRCWLIPNWLQRSAPGTRAQIPTHAGPFRFATPRTLRKLRQLRLQVDYWTINDPDEAGRLVALGVDGIMTDDPARIVPAVRAAGG